MPVTINFSEAFPFFSFVFSILLSIPLYFYFKLSAFV